MRTRIRGSQPEDEEAIASLLAASWRGAYQGLLPDELAQVDAAEIRARRANSPRTGEPRPEHPR